MKFFLCLCWLLALSTEIVIGDPCGEIKTSSNGTITNPDKLQANATTCTWYIKVNASSQVTLKIPQFSFVSDKDYLVIYSGNNTKKTITNITGKDSAPLTIISNADVTTIVYHYGTSQTSQFAINYDSAGCKETFNTWKGTISSPRYLPDTGDVTCQYSLTYQGAGEILVLTFLKFNLTSGHNYLSYGSTKFKGSALPADVYSDGNEVDLTLVIKNSTDTQQGFQLSFSAVDKACGFTQKLNSTNPSTFLAFSSTYPSLANCHVTYTAPTGKTLMLMVVTFQMQTGSDSIVVTDGGSSTSREIVTLGSETKAGDLALSSQEKITLISNMDGSSVSRNITISVMITATGGLMYDKGNLSNRIKLNATDDGYFQLVVDNSKQVQLNLNTTLMSSRSFVDVYDGLNPRNPPLYTFKSKIPVFPLVSSGNRLLVVARNLTGLQSINATFTGVAPVCNKFTNIESGRYNFTPGQANVSCSYRIRPVTKHKFGVLKVKTMNLCKNDTITVYEGLTRYGARLMTLNGSMTYTSSPQIRFSAKNGASVLYQAFTPKSCKRTGVAVAIGYNTIDSGCGALGPGLNGSLSSPNYPNQYPLNARCAWTFKSSNKSLLYMTFNNMQLSPGHTLNVYQVQNKTRVRLNNYTGSTMVPDFIQGNQNLSLEFSSPPAKGGKSLTLPGYGFQLTYKILSCGGNFTAASGSISSPKISPNTSTECIWIVQLPPFGKKNNSVNIVSATLSLSKKTFRMVGFNEKTAIGYTKKTQMCQFELHDGASVQDPSMDYCIGVCDLMTTSSSMWIRYTCSKVNNSEQLTAVEQISFSLKYTTYNCDTAHQCANGKCLLPAWRCNGVDECGDMTDEKNCSPKPPAKDTSKKIAAFWIPVCLIMGLIFGIVCAILIPVIYRRIKYPNYGHLKEFMEPSET